MEPALAHPAGPVHGELDGQHQAVFARHERARPARQGFREHRDGPVGKVDAVAAAERLAVDGAALGHEVADVGDRHPEPERPLPGLFHADRVVVIARRGRVDRHERQAGQVEPLARLARAARRPRRLLHHFGGELDPQPVPPDERGEVRLWLSGPSKTSRHAQPGLPAAATPLGDPFDDLAIERAPAVLARDPPGPRPGATERLDGRSAALDLQPPHHPVRFRRKDLDDLAPPTPRRQDEHRVAPLRAFGVADPQLSPGSVFDERLAADEAERSLHQTVTPQATHLAVEALGESFTLEVA